MGFLQVPGLPPTLRGPYSWATSGVLLLHAPGCPQAAFAKAPEGEYRMAAHPACLDPSPVACAVDLYSRLRDSWEPVSARAQGLLGDDHANTSRLVNLRLQCDPAWGGTGLGYGDLSDPLSDTELQTLAALDSFYASEAFKAPRFRSDLREGEHVAISSLWTVSSTLTSPLTTVPSELVKLKIDRRDLLLFRVSAKERELLEVESRRARHMFSRTGTYMPIMFEDRFSEWWPLAAELLTQQPSMTVDEAVSSVALLAEF